MKLKTLALSSAISLALVSDADAASRFTHRFSYRFASHAVASPLVHVAKRYLGSGNFTGLHAPWCAAAMRVWLAKAGYHAPRSNRAIDFAHYGHATHPRIGAVAVMRHHVGIVVGFSPRGPILLSGNHSHRVGIGAYSARRIIAYRSPI
jgi:uncharacterized protein (TIGR02594 family)